MKIRKLTITDAEMQQAVQDYIATQGVTVPIMGMTQPYSYKKEWEIEFEDVSVVVEKEAKVVDNGKEPSSDL